MSFSYCCVITGPIGVGKTTLYNRVEQYLKNKYSNFVSIREYLDDNEIHETSDKMLKQYLNNKVSDSVFQNYIQQYYIKKLSVNLVDKIVLMERSVSDSIAIFSNLANKKGKLNNIDLAIMYDNCINIDKIRQTPNYFINNFELTLIRTDVIEDYYKQIINQIDEDIKNNIKRRVFGLWNFDIVCYERVILRNRDSETTYTFDDIKNNVIMYQNLFEQMRAKKQIKLTDLGILFGNN